MSDSRDTQLDGLVSVVETLVLSKRVRDCFLVYPIETLEEMGVSFKDKAVAEAVVSKLKELIEYEIPEDFIKPKTLTEPMTETFDWIKPKTYAVAMTEPRVLAVSNVRTDIMIAEEPGVIDPLGPVAFVAAGTQPAVRSGAATAVATGVVSAVHSVATADIEQFEGLEFKGIEIDFAKVRINRRLLDIEMDVANLQNRLMR